MSPTRLAFAALLSAATPSAAQVAGSFEWPEASMNALPDARLGETIASARQAAQQAADRAWEARKVTLKATVRTTLRGAIGLGGRPTIIAAGTVMKAVPFNGESGPMLGTVTYPSGAKMVGLFGPDIGTYHPSSTSDMAEFSGWCYGATTSNPQPTDGEYHFRSGDSFVGSRHADEFEGVYENADHTRRFVGVVLLNTATPRPVRGVMDDGHGHLLATIRAVSDQSAS